ncbi:MULTISPECIES: hypothetical protein [Bradyrhizobium]|uniref:hypothetical protein n=1 Tax=Bradyrhizobium TaxID=374 RepID=UPI00041636F3|nr:MULTISPECIES: hypothetical protein [Bradyrhizobium]RZN26974.1 hypothetical protein CWO90_25340 [Bradyrhizobium sp. Leo121]
MKHDAIEPFHRDDLKRARELTYLRASAEAYFLMGIKGWKFDHDTFRLTPVLLDGSDGPVAELREMYAHFLREHARKGS